MPGTNACSHPVSLRTRDGVCVVCHDEPPAPAPRVARRQGAAAVERALLRASFADFVRAAWPVIEPTRAMLPSIAVNALTAALQAVGDGRIKRLAIACPPGVSKSLVGAVAFPAWLLLRSSGNARVMCGSYSWEFASRDSRRCRDLITSAWFRSVVRDAWAIRGEANRESDYWTTAGGRRLIVSVGGKALGERCTFQVIDDALSGADVHSPAAKKEAARWIREVLPSRLEDPERDARVLIGQRLAVDDPLSVAIEQGWSYLHLPAMLGESDEPCELLDDAGALVWRDERKPGEPLVSLLGADALARLRTELGSAAFAAQYMSKPHDDSASLFKRPSFARRWTELPERFDAEVIALDASFKESKTSDYACIQAWGARGGDRYLVEQWRKQAGFVETLAALKDIARRHPFAKVLVEAAANGHAIVDQLKRELTGVIEVKPDGGKQARAASVAGIVESGAVVLPAHASWVDSWLDEVCAFPNAKHDDQVDPVVYALRELQGADIERARIRRALAMNTLESIGPDELERRVDAHIARRRR